MMERFISSESDFWESALANRIAWFTAALGLAGFMDALYLTIEHYSGGQVTCIIVTGCDKVLSGPYSEIFGIPIALLGIFYYLFIFSGALFFLFGNYHKFFRLTLLAASAGFLASVWFISLQLFIVKSLCFYCMISAFCCFALFLLASLSFFHARKLKRNKKIGNQNQAK
ncbi:MAG TPA: vitamin K epoxide reductase family protein [Candidatus Paceibacterota bacterium]|nr:vitamin K epoxide reductase family protein [Candidatus Paceibacterota bacterium]